ncbi:SPARC-like protein 1 [Heteronotia binoei]|uniref:SPARC-like protein 1 n=1 Tax=Heteronotia binoei TaxID=13085 RepID=UPI00292DE875|nr:SPARC-like protein 1 [Heteronotia binoei]
MKTVIFLLYFAGSAVAIPSYSLMYKLGIRGLKNADKSNFRFLQDNYQPTAVPRVQHTEKTWTEKLNKTSKSWDGMQLPKPAANFSEGRLEPNHSQLQVHNTSLGDLKAKNADAEEPGNHQEDPVKVLRDDDLQEVLEEVNSVTSSKVNSRDRSKNRSRGSNNILIQHSGPPAASNNMETDTGDDASLLHSNQGHYQVKRRDIVDYYQDNQEDPGMELHKGWEEDGWKYNKNAIEMFARSKVTEQIVMEEEAEDVEEEQEGEEAEAWGGINYRGRRQTAQFNIPEDLHSSDHKDNQYGDTPRHSSQPLYVATGQDKDDEQTEGNDHSTPAELPKGGQLNNSRTMDENNPDAEWLRVGDEHSFQNSNQNSSDHKDQATRGRPQGAAGLMAIGAGSQIQKQGKSKNDFRMGNEEHDDSFRRRQEAMYQEGERIQSNGQGSINQEEQPGEEIKRGGNIAPSGTVDPKTNIKGLISTEPDYNKDDELVGSDNKEHNTSRSLKLKTDESENSTTEVTLSGLRCIGSFFNSIFTCFFLLMLWKIKTTDKPYSDGKSYEESTKASIPDPCRDFYCKTGKVCQADEEGKLSCVCQDPATCPSTRNYVCGTDNKTYEDTCQLFGTKCHLEGTKVGHQLHLDYMGACKYIPPCTDYEVEQFPVRMRDWLKNVLMQFYKQDQKKGGFLTDKQRNKIKKIYLDEKRLPAGDHPTEILLRDFEKNYRTYTYPIHWHFNRLDQHPTDRKLTHSELAPLRASLVPMKHCVTRFFQRCDSDKDKHISLQEWCHCFGIKEEDVDENLLF